MDGLVSWPAFVVAVSKELQQVRHQLQAGGNVGIVAEEVHVIESDLDDVLNAIAGMTAIYRGRGGGSRRWRRPGQA